MTSIDIDEAGMADIEPAAALFDAYRQFYRLPSDIEACRAYLRERIGHGESRVFLARRGGKAVGFMQLYPSYSSLSLRRVWILYDLFVDSAARQAGVGRRLLERAHALGVASGASELTLSTAIDNRAAQLAYERLGWVRDEAFYCYTRAL